MDWEPSGCPLQADDFRGEADVQGLLNPDYAWPDASYVSILLQHPLIFRGFGRPDRWEEPFSVRNGFESGPGWAKLVKGLAEWLEPRARELKLAGASDRDIPRVRQIKEKFGELRCSVQMPESLRDDWRRELEAVERRSTETCEVCGAPGRLKRERWWRTRCDWCENQEALS